MISYLFSSSFIIQFTFSNPCDDMPENLGTFSNPCDDVPENLGTFSNPCDDVPEKSGTFSNPCDDVPENPGTFSNPCDDIPVFPVRSCADSQPLRKLGKTSGFFVQKNFHKFGGLAVYL